MNHQGSLQGVLKDLARRIRGPPQLSAYERQVLETEYTKLVRKLERIERAFGAVHCSGCVKQEDPRAQRLLAEKRALVKTLDDIAWRLGGAPSVARSKRATRG